VSGYETEEQQIDAIKSWWKDNGTKIVFAVVIGVGGLVGGKAWLNYQETNRASASAEYQQLTEELKAGQFDSVTVRAEHIISTFSNTAYASLAALSLAKVKMESGEIAAARSKLQWAMENAKQVDIKQVARLRLARAMIADGQATAALALFEGAQKKSYSALSNEVKGDAYVANGQHDQARSAYTAAIEVLTDRDDRRILQMKLDGLGS